MIGVDCRVRMTTLLLGSQSKIHSTQHCVPYSRIHLSNVKGLKCQSEAQQDNGEGLRGGKSEGIVHGVKESQTRLRDFDMVKII